MFRRRCLYLFLTCLALAVVFHGQLLPLFAYPLTRSDQRVDAEYLLLLRRTRDALPTFSFAAEFVLADSKRRILVMRDFERRAEKIGAEPNFVETTIQMLTDCGVPRDRIDVVGDGSAMIPSELVRDAGRWLSERPPSTQLLVATHSFDCGYLMNLAKDMDPKVRRNLHIVGFDKHGVTAHNWWKNAVGLKMFLSEHSRLLHLWAFGDNRPDVDWDLDAYEDGLRKRRQQLANEFPLESSHDASQPLPQEQD